jgi:hypothetical protein
MKPICTQLGHRALSLALGLCLIGLPGLAQEEPGYAPCQHPYSVDGTLTEAEAQDLVWLAWPQTREGITGRFGYPLHFTETQDFYAITGRNGEYVAVTYQGQQATNAQFVPKSCNY